VDEGVKNVVRIGANSKSERLAEVNLRAVVQRLDLTKTEKNDRYKLMKKLEVESKEITDILAQMGKLGTEASLEAYLQAYYPEVHAQLFRGVDDDGWERVDYHRNGFVERWLKGAPWGYRRPRTVDNLRDVNITHMTGQERRLIRDAWIKDMHTELQNKFRTAMAAYDTLKKQLDAIRTELDLRVLRQANIIGVTTSGLARNLDLIRRTGAKVLVCEEAGEVLECHLLTALLPSIEHAILIGDHQQVMRSSNDLQPLRRTLTPFAASASHIELRLIMREQERVAVRSRCVLVRAARQAARPISSGASVLYTISAETNASPDIAASPEDFVSAASRCAVSRPSTRGWHAP